MFNPPRLTNAGKALYYRTLAGDGIQFTKIKLGKGAITEPIATMTDLVDTVTEIDVAVSRAGDNSYVNISGSFNNAGMAGFYWREIGLFAADPEAPEDRGRDILYCYQNAYDTADYIPAASVETVEKHITIPVIVADAEQVSCLLDPSLIFIPMSEKGEGGGVASLDFSGKIPSAQLPDGMVIAMEDALPPTEVGHDADTLQGHNAAYFVSAAALNNLRTDMTEELTQALEWVSNPNLLHNWYFVNPVNRNGLTEYAGSVYGIDRWYGPANGTVKLASGGLNVNFTTAESQMRQTIEAGKAPPGTYTLSVLYKSDKPIRLYEMKPMVIGYKDFPASDGLEIAAHTFSFTDSAADLMVFVQAQAANVPINATLVAAKLELGDHQTLAHQEDGVWVLNEVPDYGEELAKCQRYQWIPDEALTINLFPGGDGTQRGNLYFPVTMRASPVLTFRAYGNTSVSETLNVRLDSGVAQKDGASFYASGASGSYVRITEIAADANL